MLPSSASNSSQSSFDSPISQYPPQQHAWVNILPRRQPIPKYPRFYSTPLNQEEPDSTPLQMYGLEEREPSIAERPRRFLRFSRALDDIKEDFITSPTTPNPRNTAEAIRARRQSTFSSFFFDNNSNPTLGVSRSSTSASLSTSNFHGHSNTSSVSVAIPPAPPIPNDDEQEQPMKLGRRLTRRLSRLSFSQRRASYRAGNASISQPNLIGSSNQL